MPEEIIKLTNKQHALLMRCCKQNSLTPSDFFTAAIRRKMEIKSPVAGLMVKIESKKEDAFQ